MPSAHSVSIPFSRYGPCSRYDRSGKFAVLIAGTRSTYVLIYVSLVNAPPSIRTTSLAKQGIYSEDIADS